MRTLQVSDVWLCQAPVPKALVVQSSQADLINVRAYSKADLQALRQIYISSIQELGHEHYSPDQIEAWAGFADDTDVFSSWLDSSIVFVAVDSHDTQLAFGGLELPSRISCLFISPHAARRGVGSLLVEHLLSLELDPTPTCFTTEASELSKPLFEKFGFRVKEIEHTKVSDVAFTRYAMHKHT